jgi:thiamine-phosphate pyrophosphorylase
MTQMCATIPARPGPESLRLLAEAFAAAPVAAVIIMPEEPAAIAPADALPLIAAIQKAGAAALIFGDAHLARTLKADGVHLPWSQDVRAAAVDAREILGQGGIIGADAGTSSHDAMELGELGVDYVAFGLSASLDSLEAREERDGLVAWWVEIFVVPVVALDVTGASEAVAFASAGADFVSVPLARGHGDTFAAIATATIATSPEPAV